MKTNHIITPICMKKKLYSRIERPFYFSLVVNSLWDDIQKGQYRLKLINLFAKLTAVRGGNGLPASLLTLPKAGLAGGSRFAICQQLLQHACYWSPRFAQATNSMHVAPLPPLTPLLPRGRTLPRFANPAEGRVKAGLEGKTPILMEGKATRRPSRLLRPFHLSTGNVSHKKMEKMYVHLYDRSIMGVSLSEGSGQVEERPNQVEILPSLRSPNPTFYHAEGVVSEATPLKAELHTVPLGVRGLGVTKLWVNARNIKEGTRGKFKIVPMEYSLESFQRSNQDTILTHKPAVSEGYWVQTGDLLTDCASSVGGELSLGQNILVAYMPWEGYNFEDAILISERLVIDDLYTSVHIERYDIETSSLLDQRTKKESRASKRAGDKREMDGVVEQITRDIPDVSSREIEHLDSFGIVKMGSWVEEGDILVGKVTPINKKTISSYQKLLYTILEKPIRSVRDSSLRAPKGIKAKVIDIKYFLLRLGRKTQALSKRKKEPTMRLTPYPLPASVTPPKAGLGLVTLPYISGLGLEGRLGLEGGLEGWKGTKYMLTGGRKGSGMFLAAEDSRTSNKIYGVRQSRFLPQALPFGRVSKRKRRGAIFSFSSPLPPSGVRGLKKINQTFYMKFLHNGKYSGSVFQFCKQQFSLLRFYFLTRLDFPKYRGLSLFCSLPNPSFEVLGKTRKFMNKLHQLDIKDAGMLKAQRYGKTPPESPESIVLARARTRARILRTKARTDYLRKIETIHIYLAEKRKIQVGDKMAGRHGNKGIVSQILPIQDMPYLPDGTPLDMVLNPLGVPSRMNVGQIYECLLGLAGKFLGENYKVFSFDESYGPEASRSFVFNKLYQARCKTGFKWLFDPNSPGKIGLYDGRTGDCFDQKVTVGQAYMLRLVHMVDDKIHSRSTGPYSLVTQQPLRGRSKQGGQRLGEMEVWAIEGYGAAFTLLEMLTIKSDDMTGRMTLWSNLILNKDICIGTPESFKVLICELQALCLDIGLFRYNEITNINNNINKNSLREINNLINLP
uniref:DNA-directed RNA polymerase n=1 Tax=Chlorogonium capillatum TaxID=71743 RepID=A0A0S2ICW1_9CHLO|nr:beta subunit of RNA polymerase [Chlorogonium capillatum]